ncbi:hypothetical protein OH77DRAFT_1428247 [Trametes cingulata]|nr:hypothetical protein OH77DRAFT_1428247 [Trametes cingulata]
MAALVNAGLPDKLWDAIIDRCRPAAQVTRMEPEEAKRHVYEAYETLRACSLTCGSWLSAARLSLYSAPILMNHSSVQKFLATMHSSPSLAAHVRSLVVIEGPAAEFIPFARRELSRMLVNVRELTLAVNWGLYPSHYRSFVGSYAITKLCVHRFIAVDPLLRLVRALHRLEELQLEPPHGPDATHCATPPQVLRTTSSQDNTPSIRPSVLRTLTVGAVYAARADFTPRLKALGESVEELVVGWEPSISAESLNALLEYIANNHSLKKLVLSFQAPSPSTITEYASSPEGWLQSASAWIISVIQVTWQSHAQLNVICLRFSQRGDGRLKLPIFRDLIVQLLRTAVEEAPSGQQAFDRFPLEPPIVSETPEWWQAELRRPLPRPRVGNIELEL